MHHFNVPILVALNFRGELMFSRPLVFRFLQFFDLIQSFSERYGLERTMFIENCWLVYYSGIKL